MVMLIVFRCIGKLGDLVHVLLLCDIHLYLSSNVHFSQSEMNVIMCDSYQRIAVISLMSLVAAVFIRRWGLME